jgi:hypothetical protein
MECARHTCVQSGDATTTFNGAVQAAFEREEGAVNFLLRIDN